MHKHANPSSRIPTYLQPYTVENMKWQFKLLLVLFAWIGAGWAVDEYHWRKQRKTLAKKH